VAPPVVAASSAPQSMSAPSSATTTPQLPWLV
jgi:hypothetical protein